ncbi:hypothetical protein BKA66DRAFT_255804 [Pyrenochaeta sp. MPI-SDFR-AT-0127]|nr:hypothetical protein BKA66DRAFT_255804 [Pyrenochaeta sp. MPI-SDFR-AT-0127]
MEIIPKSFTSIIVYELSSNLVEHFKMRFSTLIATAIGLLASTVAACPCQTTGAYKVTNPGLYCGFCFQVIGPNDDHAYECSTSGSCRDYGRSNPCRAGAGSGPYPRDAYHCGGRDAWKRDADGELAEVAEVAFEG